MRRSLLLLESVLDGADPPAAAVEELFRSFHSLKGISAMVELREAERLAHEMETCLGAMRDQRFVLTGSAFDALVEGTNLVDQVIAARRNGGPIPEVGPQIARLAAASAEGMASQDDPRSPSSAETTRHLWKVTFTPSPGPGGARHQGGHDSRTPARRSGESTASRLRVTAGGGIVFDFVVAASGDHPSRRWRPTGSRPNGGRMRPLQKRSTRSPGSRPPCRGRPTHLPRETNFVRVDLARLDDLMRLVGDLVVSPRAARGQRCSASSGSCRRRNGARCRRKPRASNGSSATLREGVMRVRLVPVGEIFRRMPFVVRDLARDSGKRVQLELSGQATEIDKFLIERMMDPVLHLVRNAVSHGIETPDERVAAGKRPEGTHPARPPPPSGESVVLEVSDDGRGMDAAAIATRARAAGTRRLPDGAHRRRGRCST